MGSYRDARGSGGSGSWYDVMLVCENGHKITESLESSPENYVERCSKCGAKTLSECPSCNENIRGYYHIPGVIGLGSASVQDFCHKCGSPYPWKGKKAVKETKEKQANPLDLINLICDKFHKIARQLRNRHEQRGTLEINDEYDVQDLVHVLLTMFFDDIRAEEWTPSYAGKCSKMDFLLKGEDIVIELKKTRQGLGVKEIGDQLIIDIDRYKEHPNCKSLICFVYDPEGRIGNPATLEKDLSREANGLKVVVFVRPKG
ncbi:MAG: DUF2321 domain-containing protein [Candidatus Omnitrophota bacterium]|nr:DUF2321 domain-containing protein [Candidatus Omnitrophota bacterium]